MVFMVFGIVSATNWEYPRSTITGAPNFNVHEATFLNGWQIYHIPNSTQKQNITTVATRLQIVRNAWDRQMVVTAWIRPDSVNPGMTNSSGRIITDPNSSYSGSNYNASIRNASPSSYHITGLAVDIRDSDGSLARYLLNNQDLLIRANLWMQNPNETSGYVHFDARPTPPSSSNGRMFRNNANTPWPQWQSAQNNQNFNQLILGRWELVESNIARDLIFERLDIRNNGTLLGESRNIRGIGQYSETQNWRIDNNGRFIVSLLGITVIYTILELSSTILRYEGNVPGIGYIRVRYSRVR